MASSRSTQESTAAGAIPLEFEIAEILQTNRARDVWQHFDMVRLTNDAIKARCKGCGNFFKHESNSSLRNHIQKHCMAVKNNPEAGQSSMSQDAGIWNFDPNILREMMGNLIIQQTLPFNHFDNPRLTRMIQKALQPRYNQVSRTTIRRDCLKRWKEAKNILISAFENLKTGVSITSDVWSAPHGSPHSYLCVTAHWIDPVTWQMMKRVIAFELFPYPHTGENLFYLIDSILTKFNIRDKVFSISFDNASNNTSCISRLLIKYNPICNGAFFHTRCVAHIINLIVQDGLRVPQMQRLTEKFKNMLKDVFLSSRRRIVNYQKFCQETEQIYLGPCWDITTRWNSTWKMFDNAIRQRPTLQIFHEELQNNRKARRFTPANWEGIELIASLLKTFKESTTVLSGVYYPTSCLVIPQLFIMVKHLNKFNNTNDIYTTMIGPMKEKLLKYFRELPAVFTCACALNPCYNASGVETIIDGIVEGLEIDDLEYVSSLKSGFNATLSNMFDFYLHKYGNIPNIYQSSHASSSYQAEESDPLDMYNRLRNTANKRARGTSSASELGQYLGTDWIRTLTREEFENFDILGWWRQREAQFPVLASMARDLLSVQASTVASESAFSVSGRVLSIRRTRLSPASLEMAICLKDYLDAAERIQDKTTLEGEIEVEGELYGLEVDEGLTIPLSEEEEAMDEWMRNNSPEALSGTNSDAAGSSDA